MYTSVVSALAAEVRGSEFDLLQLPVFPLSTINMEHVSRCANSMC